MTLRILTALLGALTLAVLGWRDPHRIVGWQATWPTWGGRFGMPIDHIFVSNEIALHSYELGDGAGSDHRSVVAEISFVPDVIE